MLTRREWIGSTLAASTALALNPRLLRLLQQGQLIQRAIPATGEKVPVIGLAAAGTAERF